MIIRKLPVDHFGAVGCFCFTDGKLLLLKKRPDHPLYPSLWGIPAGRIKGNETPLEAISRELEEETGNKLDPENLVLMLETLHMHKGENGQDLYFRFYAYALRKGICLEEITLDHEEHSEHKLVAPQEMYELEDLIPDTVEIYEEIFNEMWLMVY